MNCLTISEVNRLAKDVLEQYDSLWIKGEISNCSPDKYSLRYFSLKDENACIPCTIYSAKASLLDFKIEDGIFIQALGKLTIYEKTGQYQFRIDVIKKDGAGDLQAKIDEIKLRLQKEGLFDDSKKRPIISIPGRIGVITSADSAAWKDFYKILNDRYPNMEILLYDVFVQGDKAAPAVIRALKYFNTLNNIDAVVITRGGGSLEDLMAFNNEMLAREIASSRHVVISAIGHEKDTSISDLAADIRASTPSNAAEIVSRITKDDIIQELDNILIKITKSIKNKLEMSSLNLVNTVQKSFITNKDIFIDKFLIELEMHKSKLEIYSKNIEKYEHIIEEIKCRIELNTSNIIKGKKEEVANMMNKVEYESRFLMTQNFNIMENIKLKLDSNDPLQILNKGYSITMNEEGKVIKDRKDIKKDQKINTRLKDVLFSSSILEIK